MNGYRKSKGIVIELTALLDVILIMLFWVMMNVRDESRSESESAAQRASQAEYRLSKVQEELDVQTARLERYEHLLRNIDKEAADNQQALMDFETGTLVTLDLRYDDEGRLIVYNSEKKLGEAGFTSESDITNCITDALEYAGIKKDDVVLCTLIYDGSTSLYRDVRTVDSAVDKVKSVYSNLYCAYINTASRD